jgi:predicted alpha-1,2-mannosidase
MKRSICVIALCLVTISFEGCVSVGKEDLTKYVDPFIGTDGHGHTFPGATLPFGMVQLSPDTGTEGWDWCSGYHYSDNSIMGFSHTHLSGTGCADYGNILVMPINGELKTVPGTKERPEEGYRSRFSHDREKAEPGYYSVFLDDYGIEAELTVTEHTGLHRYTFPEGDGYVLFDLSHRIGGRAVDSDISAVNNTTVEGYTRCDSSGGGWCGPTNYTVYFCAKFNKPFDSHGLLGEGKNTSGFFYYTDPGELLLKIGISFTSAEGARRNLEEVKGFEFDDVRKRAKEEWNEMLDRIELRDGNTENKKVFYTALYHALIAPNLFSDTDGRYIGMDGMVHTGKHYTVFSLWDTFRAEHPMLAMVYPEWNEAFIDSILKKYEQSGFLPIWELANSETYCMIGVHSIPVLVDGYFKGMSMNADLAYEAIKSALLTDPPEAEEFRYYIDLGYMPADIIDESVSKTLEFCYNDWCMAQLTGALGRDEDYRQFSKRSMNYRNLFNPETGFFQGKNRNGSWQDYGKEGFDPRYIASEHRTYTEANAWQYLWFVPQDVEGLISLMGGREKFVDRLDEFFEQPSVITGPGTSDVSGMIGQYAHGNEPSHHVAYLYDYAGAHEKTQQRINEIMKLYTAEPDGLCGNEDVGQMSAWYIFSALGFYPVCPGKNEYALGIPAFEEMVVHLQEGKELRIRKESNPDNEVLWNGDPLNDPFIGYDMIKGGGELVFRVRE